MSDTFDSILHGVACPRVCSNVSIDDHDYSYFSLMYLISAFVRKPGGFDFLERAIKLRQKRRFITLLSAISPANGHRLRWQESCL